MMSFGMRLETVTVKMWRIDMGKCIHGCRLIFFIFYFLGCRLLGMASRKMVLTFLVFLFGFSWVRTFSLFRLR